MDEPYFVSVGNEGNKVFGKLLKKMRLDANMTPNDLADKVHVHASFVRGIERGVQAPSKTTATEMFKALRAHTWSSNEVDLAIKTGAHESVGFVFKAEVRGQNRRPGRKVLLEAPRSNGAEPIRIEALIAACISVSDSKNTAQAIIERAKVFEAYLKGECS